MLVEDRSKHTDCTCLCLAALAAADASIFASEAGGAAAPLDADFAIVLSDQPNKVAGGTAGEYFEAKRRTMSAAVFGACSQDTNHKLQILTH
jgi:hypothetical protein